MAHLLRTTSADPDFQSLVKLLDEELAIRDGSEHSFYHSFNSITNLHHVVVYYSGAMPVACGAFKAYDETSVEIKRMFVLPAFRGNRIAEAVLEELERWAVGLYYKACILETGKKQPEAIRLYHRMGYKQIPNYGQYENVVNSVCMKKGLGNDH